MPEPDLTLPSQSDDDIADEALVSDEDVIAAALLAISLLTAAYKNLLLAQDKALIDAGLTVTLPYGLKDKSGSQTYLWDEANLRYVNTRTGRPVTRATLRRELDKILDGISKQQKALSQQLREGNISLVDWRQSMGQLVKSTHLIAKAMQGGGWSQIGPGDLAAIRAIIITELEYLRNFAEQIEDERQRLDGTVLTRAAQYGQQGRPVYILFWGIALDRRGFDEERSYLNPAEHCQECIDEAAKGFQPRGQMIPLGRRQCRSNDRCGVEYRNSQTGEVIRA